MSAPEMTYTEWRDGQDVTVTIPRQQFSGDNNLDHFTFTEGSFADLECPWCFDHFAAENLADAVDWALGHQCDEGGPS